MLVQTIIFIDWQKIHGQVFIFMLSLFEECVIYNFHVKMQIYKPIFFIQTLNITNNQESKAVIKE